MPSSYKERAYDCVDVHHVDIPHRNTQACEALCVTPRPGKPRPSIAVHSRLHALNESERVRLAVDQSDRVVVHCPVHIHVDEASSLSSPRSLSHMGAHPKEVVTPVVAGVVRSRDRPRNLTVCEAQTEILLRNNSARNCWLLLQCEYSLHARELRSNQVGRDPHRREKVGFGLRRDGNSARLILSTSSKGSPSRFYPAFGDVRFRKAGDQVCRVLQ